MSGRRAKKARREAAPVQDYAGVKFDRTVPHDPPASLWTRFVWLISPKRRRKALLDWTLKRSQARENYVARVTKTTAHIIANQARS